MSRVREKHVGVCPGHASMAIYCRCLCSLTISTNNRVLGRCMVPIRCVCSKCASRQQVWVMFSLESVIYTVHAVRWNQDPVHEHSTSVPSRPVRIRRPAHTLTPPKSCIYFFQRSCRKKWIHSDRVCFTSSQRHVKAPEPGCRINLLCGKETSFIERLQRATLSRKLV